MPLPPEHQAELERLVAESRRRDRLRLWTWLACIGLVVALALGGATALVVRELRRMQDQLQRQAADLETARLEYQRQLALDRQMQAERTAAAKAVGYQSGQPAAAYNAGLLRDFVAFMGKSGELRQRMQNVDTNDPKSLERFAADLEQVLHQGLGTIGQVVLRGTEPERAKPTPAPAAAR